MKRRNTQIACFLFTLMLINFQTVLAQQAARKNLSAKHQAYYDSLLKMNYDRVFPILGDKVYKKGFDIPYPFGIMINNFYGKQDMTLSNLHIGVKTPDSTFGPADFSEVIVFEEVNATVYNINTRVDMWVLPFLNIYGLLMYIPYAKTKVVLAEPVQLTSEPDQDGWTWGLGIMGAGGVGPFWLQGDYNATWSDMQLLKNKVFTQVVGIRLGQVFPSKASPEKNVSIWIGAMGVFLNNETVGEVSLNDALPDVPQEKIDEIKQSYAEWYDGLGSAGQKVADKIVQSLQDRLNGRPVGDTYITYEMDKAPASRWSGLVGAQYQFNKRWQLRAESNFIGKDRFSLLLSINYRFLGFKK